MAPRHAPKVRTFEGSSSDHGVWINKNMDGSISYGVRVADLADAKKLFTAAKHFVEVELPEITKKYEMELLAASAKEKK